MRRLLKFIRLRKEERNYFLLSIYLMACYRIALRLKPLQQIITEVRFKAEQAQPAKNVLTLSRASRLAHVAGNLVPLSTCLSKSLAGHILLAGQGYQTKIHIGVSKDNTSGFEAHAWLTHDGTIVIGQLPDLQKYQELPF